MAELNFKSRLVLAGAGTGKTYRLIQEILKIRRDFQQLAGREPRLIVCAFTRKSVQELKTRLCRKALEPENKGLLKLLHSPSMEISTIDGILSRLLRRYGHQSGLNPDFVFCSPEENDRLLCRTAERLLFGRHISLLKRAPFGFLKEALRFYTESRLQCPGLKMLGEADFKDFQKERERLEGGGGKSPIPAVSEKGFADFFKKQAKEGISFQPELFLPLFKGFELMAEEFFEEFVGEKKRSGLLEMSDLVLFSLDLLRQSPAAGRAFAADWDFWLIDEYQDTSRGQEQIFQALTGFKNLFCAGDPRQSIYLFRGADPEIFQKKGGAGAAEREALNVNYRSSPCLIRFFNEFFPEVRGCPPFEPAPGRVSDPEDPQVYFLNYSGGGEEAFPAVEFHIRRLLKKGARLSDICALSFRNKDLSRLANFLRGKDLCLELLSARGFSEKRLVLDALFFLKFLINPHDGGNLTALCRSPYFYLPDQALGDLCHAHREICAGGGALSFWSFMKKKLPDEEAVQALREHISLRGREGVWAAFESGLCSRGFMDLAHYQDPSGSSEANLWKLLSHLREAGCPLDLFYTLENKTGGGELESEAAAPVNPNALRMMTIHGSKGLEFEHVIVMDLSMAKSPLKTPPAKGSFMLDRERAKMAFAAPAGGRLQPKKKCYGHEKYMLEIKEEHKRERDRLFYVAMTRARQSLALAVPSQKPETNSWLERAAFFRGIEEISSGRGKSGRPVQSWSLRAGVYKRKGYAFAVENHFPLSDPAPAHSSAARPSAAPPPPRPFRGPPLPEMSVKSSKDFSERLSSLKGSKRAGESGPFDRSGIIPAKAKNLALKTTLGRELHHCLRLLSHHSLSEVQDRAARAFLSESEKSRLKTALAYAAHLREPNISAFLKKGHAEWPFKIQVDLQKLSGRPHLDQSSASAGLYKGAALKKEKSGPPPRILALQGQIDLWSHDGRAIHALDYKSSRFQDVESQLIFYSWVLDFMYHPEAVFMSAVYPFEGQAKTIRYGARHKALMEGWLKSL